MLNASTIPYFLLLALCTIGLECFPFVPPLLVAPSIASSCCSRVAFSALDAVRETNAFDLIGEELQQSLSEQLGVLEPNEVQNSSLPIAVRGDDVFIIAQTGSGKTLTFLLPILHQLNNTSCTPPSQQRRAALVIGPTAELVAQHAAIVAKLAPSLMRRVLFKTPQQFLADVDNQHLSIAMEDIDIVAIDEVDAVLCGTDFNETIPDSTIELLNHLPDQAQYILTTAHLTRAHTKTLQKLFPDIETVRQNRLNGGTMVPTLRQNFHYFSGNITAKLNKLEKILEEAESNALLAGQSSIIFCKDEEEVDLVHSFLECSTLNQLFAPKKLHTKLPLLERSNSLEEFKTKGGDCRLLVTHEIAARGLDCPSVRHVILFDTPTDVTAFVHRAGRTARAGEEGAVTCLVQAGAGISFGAGNSFGQHKVLHELKDAPKLNFKKAANEGP